MMLLTITYFAVFFIGTSVSVNSGGSGVLVLLTANLVMVTRVAVVDDDVGVVFSGSGGAGVDLVNVFSVAVFTVVVATVALPLAPKEQPPLQSQWCPPWPPIAMYQH